MHKWREAQRIILELVKKLSPTKVALKESLHRVLSSDIIAEENIPPFDNSAMDGYAICKEDIKHASQKNPISLPLAKTIAAGNTTQQELEKGETISIMTGAPIPQGTTAVIKKEDVTRNQEKVTFTKEASHNENIRLKGSDIKKGEKILSQGTVIKLQELGVLASLGETQIPVIQKPKVAFITTGDELTSIEEKHLEYGKIRNSNALVIKCLIEKHNATPLFMGIAKDTKQEIKEKLLQAINQNPEIIIINGGVSVGDYDYVQETLKEIGVEIKLWKVAVKPGKPLLVGTKKDTLFFGLPGNPVSTIIAFEQFVRPCIKKMLGLQPFQNEYKATLENDIQKKAGRAHFMRAKAKNKDGEYVVTVLPKQGSHMLSGLLDANCVAIAPEETKVMKKGEKITILLLDE